MPRTGRGELAAARPERSPHPAACVIGCAGKPAGSSRLAFGTRVRVYRRGMTSDEYGWVPPACTSPTAQRPVRSAEFDALFATALWGQWRLSPTVLRWRLDPGAEQGARELAARESACCSFFLFSFGSDGDAVRLDVEVPAAHVEVLDALAGRAAADMAS